jgi:hypothetical protein
VFRRSDRQDGAPDEATFGARNAATQGFLALDDEQRAAAAAVQAADEIGGGTPLGPQWAAVSAACDRATEAYLTATQQFPLDGSAPFRGAKAADEAALRDISAARQAITRFRAQHSRQLDEADMLIRNLPHAVQEARVALTTARSKVAQAAEAGVPSKRANLQLDEAERTAQTIDITPGLRERAAIALRTAELAQSAITLAEEAPRTASSVQGALRSVATRIEAATGKVERIEPTLSTLRREFSEPCSRDLTGAEREATAAISSAQAALRRATGLAGTGEWDDAADAITEARNQLGAAEARQQAVLDRLALLREAKADPSKMVADVRFVLRDTQRLVVDRGLVGRYGQILDAQVTRLDQALERLTGIHPDYWLFVTELHGVRDRAKEVVSEVRGAAAQQR